MERGKREDGEEKKVLRKNGVAPGGGQKKVSTDRIRGLWRDDVNGIRNRTRRGGGNRAFFPLQRVAGERWLAAPFRRNMHVDGTQLERQSEAFKSPKKPNGKAQGKNVT